MECVRYACGFCLSIKSPLPTAAHRLTSVTFNGKELVCYEYDRYDTNGKVLKSSSNLGEEWTFDYRKDHTVVTDALGRTEVYGFDENRELVYRIDAEGQRTRRLRPHYRRMRPRRTQNPPINPLLPLRPNWYP